MVRTLSEPAVAFVMANLRAADRLEVLATVPDPFDAATHARHACAASEFGAVVYGPDGRPAVAMGATPIWPGVWSVWLLATDAWPACWRATFRWAARMIPACMRRANAHRVQVFAACDNPAAAALLKRLGFRREGIARRFGRGGQDFGLWARVAA